VSSNHSTEICEPCSFEPFVRNNYFTGKMMGAAEFIAESRYHQEKLRLHQVRLHGWGVVCGLDVVEHGSEACRMRYVIVRPGSAIDCCGNDILVSDDEIVDLLDYKAVIDIGRETTPRLHTLGICVRFSECAAETVPVLYDDCGCNDDGCAPNRILESYAFDVVVDPPLGENPKLSPGDVSGGAFIRPATASLTGPTPRLGVAALAAGKLHALDPTHPQALVSYDLATRHTHSFDLGATAYDLAASGDRLFVATAAQSGGSAPLIQVFSPGVAAPKLVDTGLAAGTVIQIAAGAAAGSDAVVYVPGSAGGDVLAFADDTLGGLTLPPTTLGTIGAGLAGFVLSPDGKLACATDGNSVTLATLAPFAAAPLGVVPTGTKIGSMAFTTDGKLLAVADPVAAVLHLFDPAGAGAYKCKVPLDHAPALVAAGPGGLIHVIEEQGGVAYLQTIDTAPVATGQPSLVAAARLIDGTDERLVIFGKAGQVGVAAHFDDAAVPCEDLIWHQTCCSCGSGNCVILATIHGYTANAAVLDADETTVPAGPVARIDNRDGRKVLASTATLQAWLECLELQGKIGRDGVDGGPGAPGLGLNAKLPKIIDVSWLFEQPVDVGEFAEANIQLSRVIAAGGDAIAEVKKLIENRAPLLMLYFDQKMAGITRQTLGVSISAPLPIERRGGYDMGIYDPTDLRPYGDIIEIDGAMGTPHTPDTANYAVCFVPREAFFLAPDDGGISPYWKTVLERSSLSEKTRKQTETPLLRVWLKGDFVVAASGPFEGSILDADNIGGVVGVGSRPAFAPLKGPSGNYAQGGLFESWFWLTGHNAPGRDFRRIINEASVDDLIALPGIGRPLAIRIDRARAAGPIRDLDDLAGRIRLTAAERSRLASLFEPE